jgi:heme exporter protein B
VRAVGALLRKDLRTELRTGETVPAMCLFAVTTFVIFHFALDEEAIAGNLASGVMWVTVLFAGILGINRLFVAEREQGGFDGFLLAPVDRTAMLVAKATALFLFLVALEIVAVPAFAILLLDPSPIGSLPQLAGVLLLGDLGIAVIGTLTSALAVQTRARDLIVPIVSLPLLVPLIIAATSATSPLWAAHGAMDVPLKWIGVLGLYDLTFGLIAYAVFDFLLED